MGQKFEKGVIVVLVLMFLIGAYLAYSAHDYSCDINELTNQIVARDAKIEARLSKIESKLNIR